MRYLYMFIILSALLCSNSCLAQVADSARIVGTVAKCWRVISHEYSTIYGLEEEEIKAYSKQKVCFAADSVRMHTGVSYSPRYSVKKVNAEEYAKTNFDCDKRRLGISIDSVYEIVVHSVSKPTKNGTIHKMTNAIVFDGDCIYVPVDGIIFRMFDADAKVVPRAAR